MGFLEIESLCLSTGQVKCKQKGSSLLAAVFWPTHCSAASLWFCIPCAEALAQLSADAVTFVCSLRKMQRNLPGCWGKKVRWSVDQARMESIWCPSTLPGSTEKWSNSGGYKLELSAAHSPSQRQESHGLVYGSIKGLRTHGRLSGNQQIHYCIAQMFLGVS